MDDDGEGHLANYRTEGQTTAPTTDARDMMQDKANARIPEFQKGIRRGRASAAQFIKDSNFKYVK
jgi:hypothetical protein